MVGLRAGLSVLAVLVAALRAQAPVTDATLELGIRQYGDGDFEAAVFSLDSAARRLAADPSKKASLVQAYLYLGASFIGLEADGPARGKFREALRLDPQLRLSGERFPDRVVRVFESEVVRLTATKGRRRGKVFLVVGAVGAAAAVALATTGEPANRPPTAEITVTPDGEALVPVTEMTLTASAADLDGDALTYHWDFGDGASASGLSATHVYGAPGIFPLKLTVADARGASTTAQRTLLARTLTGLWDQGNYRCTQTGDAVECSFTPATRACGSNCILRFVGSVSNPRRIRGGLTWSVGGPDRCEGEVSSNLNQVRCDPFFHLSR